MKKVVFPVALIAASATLAGAQVINVGPHTANYTGFSRGFSYIAPVDHTIIRLEIPPNRFAPGDLASYVVNIDPQLVGGGVLAVNSTGNAGAIAVNVPVLAGQNVLIIGNWTTGVPGTFTAKNSYNGGAAPFASFVLGNATTLFRGGFQSDIAGGGYTAGAGFTGLTGSIGRIFVTVIPAPASLALLGLGGLVAVRRRR